MKVQDIMIAAPKCCRPDTNLAAAVELMWVNDCGFLPVVDHDGRIAGVITDRDICVALGTRNQRASEVCVREAMTDHVYTCAADDDIHSALKSMEENEVRRLPVVTPDGELMGVLSIGDVTLYASGGHGEKRPELSTDDVVEAFQGIRARQEADQFAQLET